MPRATLTNVLAWIKTVIQILQEVSDIAQIPLVSTISRLSSMLVDTAKDVNGNKERWLRALEDVHSILCALATLCATQTQDLLSPTILDTVGRLARVLQKIQSCMRSQQELGTLRRFFKQTEILEQLNGCETELMAILEVFKMTCGIQLSSALLEMELGAERYHAELLGLIEGQSVRFESCSASSINESYRQLSASSSIFPLLPPTPEIFHGRESELQEISTTLLGHYPRVAVLGPGGIGKTPLAAAAIHSPLIVERFVHRHFISCESASSGKILIAMIGAHFGLEPSRTLSQEIRNHLTAQGDTLIVLDNLETLWEPANSRADVEQFLSILDDVPQLALMVFYSETVVLCVLRARSRSPRALDTWLWNCQTQRERDGIERLARVLPSCSSSRLGVAANAPGRR